MTEQNGFEKAIRKDRIRTALQIGVPLLIFGTFGWLWGFSEHHRANTWRDVAWGLTQECHEAEGCDPDNVEVPEEIESEQGQPGIPGEPGPGPTAEQIAIAIANYCADGSCVGTPTEEQILAAVTTYCSTGACTGESGQDGAPGSGPTAEQIAEAVTGYCASGACAGPQGVSVVSMQCDSNGRWIVSYSDGRVEDAGYCWPPPPVEIPVE